MVSFRRLLSISVLFVVVIALAGVVGLFAVDAGSGPDTTDPVPFHDTVTTGVVLENVDDADGSDEIDVPKAQVFYSQYEYVVGYRGVERFVDAYDTPDHEERFGYPLAVYVTDYGASDDVQLTAEGYPTLTDGSTDWIDAESAVFVVNSEARTPAGETVVPFSDRADADTFVDNHGGTVVGWENLLEYEFEIDDADVVRDRAVQRHAHADELVAETTTLRDRSVAVVVGEDAATLEEAVEIAPAESTVIVPEGVHEVPDEIEVDRPITIVGQGTGDSGTDSGSDGDGNGDGNETSAVTTLRGNGDGSVLVLTSDRAAVADLRIDGVGNTTEPDEDEDRDVDDALEMAYGQSDAGVELDEAPNALVENVTIETPATGVLLRDAPESVVRNVSVHGSDHWSDSYMAVTTIRSPNAIVEDSTLTGGRDGIYLHRSDGIVFRNNELENNRIGVHLMYTSNTLIADNRIEDPISTGIDVMTSPEHNAVVGNEVRNASQGILMAGSRSYVADNLVTNTQVGLTTGAGNSIYEGNVLADNVQGVQANHMLPTNEVTGNDFVGNDEHANARLGTLRVWSEDGKGNFWHGAIGVPGSDTGTVTDGATLERSYAPTDPVDKRLHRVDGTPTLTRAPAIDARSMFEGAVSGMRSESIVDRAPLCEPANPDLLERTEWEPPERTC
ncbi:ABC-type transport system periplasmic substrate-binding protein (probable substrate copper) [Natrialba magadii ATCC 43099]|uniref:ABC-type transport system periplasmic substrate-binding protein (Probable substrate copper) n=1 Tax=Natrialba magadii (strain ATCC 43099 / DSM 3394 / CCM 3739 / CIP 104546 / IAM 13178 / JCM 8861 / NBRC 102185 / NCIMB 2190 / MS3) TaxID=547559 RepID=D3T017_NATMM|nr:right-handed parallel beta-helix repeat-containing protein [Natrialba magadii]ADD04375.1 ABC-type transport system periplasmic substrate-binding protein (probable substrate copper) [Natrialba magadii ATCC 43099]ELY26015.1 NosL family protein [Natrialba magadii ATCC 43099]